VTTIIALELQILAILANVAAVMARSTLTIGASACAVRRNPPTAEWRASAPVAE
jgi:hypothetical protein